MVEGAGVADGPAVGDEVEEPAVEAVAAADEGEARRGAQAVEPMIVYCPTCQVCGQRSVLDGVDALGYVEWSQLGKNIQDALPELDADQRELLMTGTHAHCWMQMWEGSDE